jgi:signal transduction histidine kinase
MPFHSVDDPAKLRRLLEATLLVEADLELPVLLGHVVEEACSMTGARYGALGVLNEDRTELAQFITVGLDPDEEERIGHRPTGRGVLGLLITEPQPLRLADLGSHPDSFGFPAHHPPMVSFLGVPIKVRDEVYGNLYLTDKVGWSEFTADDVALVEALAVAAGIAIENARLHERVREVAVVEDRDRLARDLHDTVIQRLFAVGLSLQSLASTATGPRVTDRLAWAISDIDDTIGEVRSVIYALSMAGDDRGVRASVLALVRELTPVVGFEVNVTMSGPVDTSVPDTVAHHLLATIREALTNIGRHAHATSARVILSVTPTTCLLEVVDDGTGIPGGGNTEGGLGLGNLQRRAEKLRGSLILETPDGGGTSLRWRVPLGS